MPSNHRYSRFFPAIFLIADLLCLNLGILVAYKIRFASFYLDPAHTKLLFFLNLIWLLVFWGTKLQEINRNSRLLDHLNKVLSGLVVNLSIVFALWFAAQPLDYSRKYLFITYLVFTVAILSWRTVWHYFIRYYRAKGYNFRNVLIIGENNLSQSLIAYIKENPFLGYRVAGILRVSDLSRLQEKVDSLDVDILYCCLPNLDDQQLRGIINYAESNLIKVNLFSQFSKLMTYNMSIQQLGNIPVISINTTPLDRIINRAVKRTFDIVFSLVFSVGILSWLVPLVAIFIRLESKGPIFFKQDRHGRDNRLFTIYKFRSMFLHDESGVIQAKKDDARITKVGAILRKTSIDELPQFFNVLKGEMSIVGPRPHAIQHNIEYQPQIDKFWQRHAVKPGITGLAQAKGFRGETAELSDMSGRVKLDRFYVKNWSLILDFKIIILTVLTILKGDQNAY
ncbi:MAG: undecaprenyl-phosphate glucose phosphotransferase [Bacteroidota bacterium]